jgi:hypothetical protein
MKGICVMSENILVDPNTADEETLAKIPGIGEEMAKRILNARPYTSLEDMQRVNGIGPVFLETIASYLELSPSGDESIGEDEVVVEKIRETEVVVETDTRPEEETISTGSVIAAEVDAPPEETEVPSGTDVIPMEEEAPPEEESVLPLIETSDDEDASLPEIAPPPDETEPADQDTTPVDEVAISEVEPPNSTTQPAYTTRGQAFLMSCGCSTLAIILTLVIGIGVLAGLNSGNLIFATPAQVSNVALEVERIDKEVKGIKQDLDGLQIRVNNLEGLTSRVDEVEQTAKDLGTQVVSITSQVTEMDQEVQTLATDVETLQEESSRYQEFFNGLRELLSTVLSTEEGSDE